MDVNVLTPAGGKVAECILGDGQHATSAVRAVIDPVGGGLYVAGDGSAEVSNPVKLPFSI